jgi:hypothetical protein
MSKFNQLLILITLALLFGCIRIAIADECNYVSREKSLSELQDVSKWLRKEESVTPWRMYHYNGRSVTKEQYERLMKKPHDKNVDPGERMP